MAEVDVIVGTVGRAHGLRGEVPLWPLLQLTGLVVLAILAAPRVRRRR